MTAFYGYSAYGETQALGVDGYVPANASQYTARENDGLVGGTNGGALYYYRARYYDPVLKRFVSEDPVGVFAGNNFYAFVDGNPVSLVDPEGETPWGLIFAGADLGWQLYQNGGNLSCVDWTSVGLSLIGGGLLNGLVKGAFKFKSVGSHTWDATAKWMNKQNILPTRPGQQRHHWFLERNQGIGKGRPDWLKNQPWNINPISAGFNNWLGKYPALAPLGAPSWAAELGLGAGTVAAGAAADDNCKCQ